MPNVYAIALGSNRPHGRYGAPARVIAAALEALRAQGVIVLSVAPTFTTAPLGPSGRCFANGAALIQTPLDPPALLALLKATERAFGRRRGRRWGARVLDLDIILWSGGRWHGRGLDNPHRQLAYRAFVLDPLAHIAGDWRIPGGALRVRHLRARLKKQPA
jgi:2-amino-4-hydroxy-6-hydroxymethyldihydropteridine diphosphokinase